MSDQSILPSTPTSAARKRECRAKSPDGVGYFCSKPFGHEGDHVATAAVGQIFCARWPAASLSDTPTSVARLQCEGRYPVPQTSPPREEPFEVTYRCALPSGHDGPHGPAASLSDEPEGVLDVPFTFDPNRGLPRPPEGFVRDAVASDETLPALEKAIDDFERKLGGSWPRRGSRSLESEFVKFRSALLLIYRKQREEIERWEAIARTNFADYQAANDEITALCSQLERLRDEQLTESEIGTAIGVLLDLTDITEGEKALLARLRSISERLRETEQ